LQSRKNKQLQFRLRWLSKDLQTLQTSDIVLPVAKVKDLPFNYSLANNGELIFLQYSWATKKNGATITLHQLSMGDGGLRSNQLVLDSLYAIFNPCVKIDNATKQVLLMSQYAENDTDIEGGWLVVMGDLQTPKWVQSKWPLFQLQKAPLNLALKPKSQYVVTNISLKKESGFIASLEAWDIMDNEATGINPSIIAQFLIASQGFFLIDSRQEQNRKKLIGFHAVANDIVLLHFDAKANLQKGNIINKTQSETDGAETMSYLLANSGDGLHYFYNQKSNDQLSLRSSQLLPNGNLTDKGNIDAWPTSHLLMPKWGKQTGVRTVVMPCVVDGQLRFARLGW
jgi:hypothetical protein